MQTLFRFENLGLMCEFCAYSPAKLYCTTIVILRFVYATFLSIKTFTRRAISCLYIKLHLFYFPFLLQIWLRLFISANHLQKQNIPIMHTATITDSIKACNVTREYQSSINIRTKLFQFKNNHFKQQDESSIFHCFNHFKLLQLGFQ